MRYGYFLLMAIANLWQAAVTESKLYRWLSLGIALIWAVFFGMGCSRKQK